MVDPKTTATSILGNVVKNTVSEVIDDVTSQINTEPEKTTKNDKIIDINNKV